MNNINMVDELKDLLNEYINIMYVTEDIEQLKKTKEYVIYCIEKIYDFNYKEITKNT